MLESPSRPSFMSCSQSYSSSAVCVLQRNITRLQKLETLLGMLLVGNMSQPCLLGPLHNDTTLLVE